MKYPTLYLPLLFSALALLATTTEGKTSNTNFKSNFKPNPNDPNILSDFLNGPRLSIDDLLGDALEISGAEDTCAKSQCIAEHSAAECTPLKINTYKPRCAKVFSNLGIEKPKKGKGLPEEEKQRLRKLMKSDEVRKWVDRQTGGKMGDGSGYETEDGFGDGDEDEGVEIIVDEL